VIPILGVASLASLPTIRLFFGDQWDSAAPAASWIAIWAIFRCIHWFANDVLITTCNERLILIKDLIPFTLLVFLIIIAYPFGLERIAIMFLVIGVIEFIVTTIILMISINLSILQWINAWWSNIFIFTTCYLTTWIVGQFIPFDTSSALKVVFTLFFTVPVIWFLTLYVTKNPLYYEIRKVVENRLA
jgi:hypothetical protein